jgi:Replication protein
LLHKKLPLGEKGMDANPELPLWAELEKVAVLNPERRLITPSQVEEDFRHAGWKLHRRRIFHALHAAGASPRRLERFACCGALAAVWWNDQTGELQVRGSHCHDRFCRPCAAARGIELQRAIANHIPAGVTLRFVTLTIRHQAEPLKDVLERLRCCFTRLRNRAYWKAHVTGGVQVLEVKLSEAGLWHPHLHMILQGSFMDWQELSKEWHKVTGDSFHVDIRVVKDSGDDARELGRYVTKYICKPAGVDLLNDALKLVEYVAAMKGQRVLNFLGSWRGIMDDAGNQSIEDKARKDAWHYLKPLNQILQEASAGDAAARNILLRLAQPPAEPPPPAPLKRDTVPEII